MIEVRQTPVFASWLKSLKDRQAQARITDRLVRLESGLFGDVEPVGEGVSELRLQFGPGYRVYFVQRGKTLIILLCGGDKSSQTRDIKEAKRIAKEV